MKVYPILLTTSLIIIISAYQNYSIIAQMRVQAMTFTHNQDYLIVSQKSNQESPDLIGTALETLPLLLFKRTRGGYQVIDRLYSNIPTNAKPIGEISISRQTNRFSMAWNDSYVRVYQLQNDFMKQLQKIPYNNSTTPYISDDGNYLIVNKLYKWNAQTKQYEGGSELGFGSTQYAGVSHDLKTIITQQMIYTFNGETYTSYRLDMVGLSSARLEIKGISDVLSDGTRFVIFRVQSKVIFCILNGTIMTFVQNIDNFQFSHVSLLHLTSNGQYIAIGFSYYRKEIRVYKYSEKIKKFEFNRRHSGFKHTQASVLISEDGKTVVGAAYMVFNSIQTEQLVFYIDCGISKCEKCHLDGKSCLKCQQDYISKNTTCVCQLHKSEVNGRCVDCLISHCYQCKKRDECEVCGNGYILIQGVCFCPSYKNISSINGNCVSCEVQGCIKCDVPNICSRFSDGLSGSHITYSFDKKQQEKKQLSKEKIVPNEQLKIQLKNIEQKKVINQPDTLTLTVTKGEQIEGLIIFILLSIIICMCKKCRHMRVKMKLKEEFNEQIPQKKQDTNHDINKKRDGSFKPMEQA